MSGNHQQSLDRALEIVEEAARTGAHALKLQTYTPDTMTLDLDEGDFHVNDGHSLWGGNSLYQLYQQAYTPWEWHQALFARGRALGITVFSTPFDETAVDFLESLNAPCYKIASFENTDLGLIRKVAATGKPMIVSTGMATLAALDETVRTARAAGCRQLILLKCTSAYPASPSGCNLATLPNLRELFDCETGVSDHTMGLAVPLAAIALGATVIEKHFTLRRADGGVDAAFSLEPAELGELVNESRRAWQAIGKVTYGTTDQETASRQFRRSLYVVKDLKAGQRLTPENLRAIRPGMGLEPKHFGTLLGRAVVRDIKRGTPASWSLFC
jgi:pseudaminic acid synthase